MPSLSRRRHAPKGRIKQPADAADLMDGPAKATCTGTSKRSGKRCKKDPIVGGTVCHIHGGNAPQVREAAMARLLRLQYPAIDRMEKLIDQEQFPSVSYAASRDVLDRTMGKPTESVQLEHSGELIFRWKTHIE